MLEELTTTTFDEKTSTGTVCVKMTAHWCSPCSALTPVLQSLQSDLSGSVAFYELDVDDNPEISKRLKIKGIPTTIAFKDGVEIGRLVGVVSKEKIKELLT